MGQVIGTGTPSPIVRANAGTYQTVGNIYKTETNTVPVALVNAGDILLIPIVYFDTTTTVTSITGANGKLTDIALLAPRVTDTTNVAGIELWNATIKSTGAETVQINFSQNPPNGNHTMAVEFTANYGPETEWFILNSASADVTTASSTISWQSLGVPSISPAIYFGYAAGGDAITAGSTSGFSYLTDLLNFTMACYDTTVTTAVTPTAHQNTSQRYLRTQALMAAVQGSTIYDTTCDIRFPVVPTGIQWVIYQLSVEVITSIGVQNVAATAYLNHRSTYSFTVPGTIQGPPYYTIRPGDDLVVTVTGAPVGSQCVATLLYHEYLNGPTPPIAGVV